MKHNHYARKKRQLKLLANELHDLLKQKSDSASQQIELILQKMRVLLKQLSSVISSTQAKKILGATMVIFGFTVSQNAAAQTFALPVKNAFSWAPTNQQQVYLLPAMADMDNDGDLDMLVTSYGENYDTQIALFENLGTAKSAKFSTRQSLPFGMSNNYAFPTAVDIDGDGDYDIFALVFDSVTDEVNQVFIENTGTKELAKFETAVKDPFGFENTSGQFLHTVFADIDGDGDLDAFTANLDSGSGYATSILFRENIGDKNNPEFTDVSENPFGLTPTYYFSMPTLADVDGDGDLDLLVAEYYGVLNYFENKGTKTVPSFAPVVQNPFGINFKNDSYLFPTFVDIDNDGDIDILGGELYGVLQFFENTTITSVKEFADDINITLSPNPVKDVLSIQSNVEIKRLEIVDLIGKTVLSLENPQSTISLSNLKTGAYTVKVIAVNGGVAVKRIEKQ